MNPEQFQSYAQKIIRSCGRVIVGKDEVIRQVVVTFLCGGHVLLEDVPGTGKTMLLRAFSRTVGGRFKRIQFTPDLLPSDLTGINFYNPKAGEFEFRPGPLFSGMILADEIILQLCFTKLLKTSTTQKIVSKSSRRHLLPINAAEQRMLQQK